MQTPTRTVHNDFDKAKNKAKEAKREAKEALHKLMTAYAFEIADYLVETTGATDADLDKIKGTLLNMMSHTQERFKEYNHI